MTSPRDAVVAAETAARLLPGADERLSGWGLMGLPFRGGDVLATRSFVASSIGPGYHSVWHRAPNGEWTFYVDSEPTQACPRYFGAGVTRAVQCEIRISWPSAERVRVEVPVAGLVAEASVAPTFVTRMLSGIGRGVPEVVWRSPAMLAPIAAMAGPMLGAGKLALSGTVPNGQRFIANPRRIWVVTTASLTVGARSAGKPGAVHPQAQLGDFRIPQRGLLAIGNAAFEALDATCHLTAVSRSAEAANADPTPL